MKKALSAVLAVVLVLGVCFSVPMIASANDTDPSDFDYKLTDDGYVITGFNGTVGADGIVTIPATYTLGEGETIANGGVVVRPVASSVDDPVDSDAVEGSATGVAVTEVTNGDVEVTEADGKVTLKVTPNRNYVIDKVSVVDGDSATVTTEVSGDTYTFSKETGKTYTVTVTFKLATYTVTINAGENGEVTAKVGETTVTSVSTVNVGSNVVLTITPDKGYQIDSFKENGVPKTVSGNTYTIENVSADVTIDATFKEIPDEKYTITANVTGAVFTVANEAEEDEPVNFTVVAAKGYQLGKGTTITYTLAGEEKTESLTAAEDGSYSFTMPAANVKITVTSKLIKYPVTAQKDANGAVYFDKTENVTYTVGETVKVYVKPAKPFACAGVEVTYGTDGKITATKGETAENVTEYTFQIPEIDGKAEFLVVADINPTALDVVGIEEGVFADTTGIKEFKLATGQDNFTVEGGVLFDGTTLLAYPDASTVESYTLPANVTAIAEGAFAKCTTLKYVFTALGSTFTANNIGVNNCPITAAGVLHIGMQEHGKVEDESKRVDATCVTAGTKYYKCTLEGCDYVHATTAEDTIPADGTTHNMGDWVTTKPATCTETGTLTKYCSNEDAEGNKCTHTEIQVIPATGVHVPGEGVVTREATCKVAGVKTYYCVQCSTDTNKVIAKTEEISAKGHSLNDPDERKLPTCTEDGYEKGLCDNCKQPYEVVLEAPGHTMITVVDAKATCTVAGSQHEECKTCGYMDEDAVIGTIPALGHSKAEETAWTIVTEATCAEAGLLQKFCDTCRAPLTDKDGKEITRVLEATGEHEYKDYTETKAPTCTEKGEETGTCACGATDVREVKALGHKFAEEFTTDKEATCTEAGSKSKHCTAEGCKEKSEVTAIPVKPHTADDTWTTVEGKAATCYAEGEKTGTCAVCKTQNCVLPIEKLAHTWAGTAVPVVGTITKEVEKLDKDGKPVLDEDGEPVMETITYKAATCEAEGYTVKYCTVENCGAYDEASLTKVDKLGHDFDETHDTEKPSNIQPTCDEVGYKFVWCKRCSEANKDNENKGYVKVEVAATGHNWEEKAKNLKEEIEIEVDGKKVTAKAPDCENAGYTAIYCATCGDYKDVTPVAKLGHSVLEENWTTKSEATCVALKVEKNTCNRCNEEVTREVGKLADHDFSEKITRTYPTCEEDGIEYYACTVAGCKAKDQEKVLPKLGHVHADDAEFVGTDATCEKAGEKIKACTRLFNADGSLYVEPTTDEGEEGDTTTGGDDNATTGGTTGTENSGTATVGEEEPTLTPCEGLKQVTKATGHAFSDKYTVDREPTCTEPGLKSRHCTNTGCTVKTNELPVKELGHEYGEKYTVDTKATCSSVGYESIHCTRYDDCETKKTGSTREIPKTDHTYPATGWQPGVAATCEGEGTKTNACSVCKAPVTEKVPAKGHEWSEYYTTVPAKCTEDGEVFIKCTKCDAKKEGTVTVIPATGHTLATEGKQTIQPTCTKRGYDIGTCTNDGCTVAAGQAEANVTSALGHDWSGNTTIVNPTCTTDGRKTGVCTRCTGSEEGATTVETIPAPGHTYGEWEATGTDCEAEKSKVRKCTVDGCDGKEYGILGEHTASGWIIRENATCGTDGEMYTKCKICAEPLESETIKATGKHDLKETITTAPTCIDAGEKTVECQAEGCTYTDTVVIPANGHSYTEWKVFVEPTCTTKGIRQSVCEVCLTTQSEKILALGHDLGDYITDTPAACGKVGSKHKECSRCDYKTDAETIAALKHNFVGNDCANKCGAKIYEYALVEGRTTDIIITKYNGSEENLVIPAVIDEYNVVAIGDRAFMKTEIETTTSEVEGEDGETTTETTTTVKYIESDFTSLTIPASIAKIGDYAFANSKLTLVNIPATVTTIGKCAFGYDVEITIDEGENTELVENIKPTPVANFTIYGVKDSAAETYAKQDATKEDDDFTFVEVKNVYDVVIDEEETNIVEVADGIIFKEFEPVNKDDDSTKIVNQIKAVIELPENSDYKVEVEASLAGGTGENAYAFYGTGSKILVTDANDKVIDEIVVIIEGDVNGDSVVDAIDCMLIQLAATNDDRQLEGAYFTAGNFTPDSAITADDLNQAVLKIFGEDLLTGKEETTTEATTQAPAESTTQAPAESTPAESTPAESTPAESTPAESTPAESTPAESTPAESTPAESTPAESTPAQAS